MNRSIGIAGLLVLALGCPVPAAALPQAHVTKEETLPVIPMVHTRWLVRDGAPPNILAMAQTADGWLWLGSSVGLFRFDGVRFTQYRGQDGVEIPPNIGKLGVLGDGTLWIAPQLGKLYFLRDGKLQRFDRNDGLPPNAIRSVVRDQDGQTWLAGGQGGLLRLDADGKTWRQAGDQFGLSATPLRDLMVDRRGTMWAMGLDATYARRRGEPAFERVASQQEWGELHEAPDGTVWASDLGGKGMRRLFHVVDDPRHREAMRGIHVEGFMVDRRGNMWFSADDGIGRVQMDGGRSETQNFSRRQGLSSKDANVAFQDREGSVWVGTASGLDQFRDSRMREIPLPPYTAETRPVVAGPDGSLWIDHVFLRDPASPAQPFGPPSTQATLVTALYRDPHGGVWCGGLDGLWRVEGRRRTKVTYPTWIKGKKFVAVFGMAMDDQDGLWVSTGAAGLARLKDGTWTRHGGLPELKGLGVLTAVRADDGAVWFGSVDNTLAILRNGTALTLAPVPGLDIGSVMQIVPRGRGAWLGGADGLAYFDGLRARRIEGQDGERFVGATGLVLAPDGTLWANTGRGLVGIAAMELQRARADAAYRVRYRRFDENDGLVGTAGPMLALPSLVRMPAGELIVSTSSSVFRFDPAHAAGNRVIPPVHVTGISADGVRHDPSGVVLPPGPDMVRIDYTALSLALPQRVRFRYMLEGVDPGWQDAGTRRTAFYTKLPPGDYTFRVIAANDDGLWNETGARVMFKVPPTTVQTWWFRLACALLLALGAWGLYRQHLRRALRRMTLAFEARVTERERIARDLHDTLLQSVQGLILVFRRIAMRTPDGSAERPLMEEALALAVETLEEARDKVTGLRTGPAPGMELGADLDAYGRRLAQQHGVAFTLVREGRARALRPAVLDELQAIGREAIRNAFVHAQASRIDVELAYRERALELVVRDDGSGIDPGGEGGTPGHWGIPGMRERAAALGASFELSSAPGTGAIWKLRLGAHLAYAAHAAQETGPAPARHMAEEPR